MSTPLVILGPTASGKSDVAMAFALRHGAAEVLAVDSMQVYRRMNIGTAKPSAADRGAVAHHGIDLAEPSTDFAVTHFERGEAMAQISRRERCRCWWPVPVSTCAASPTRWKFRGGGPSCAALEERAAREGSPALHAELVALDPIAAARMEPTNLRRVTRALEVTLGSGRPFSSFGPGLDQYPPVPFVQVGLQWPRPVLAERIAARVHRMMAQGLLAEVESLLAESPPMSRTARQALGYKELIAHLEGTWSLDEAVAAIIVRTRQFAVRQERWFRRDPRIRWVHIEHDPVAEIVPLLFPS